MPHTDPKADTLEIAGKTLAGGRIEPRYVVAAADLNPVVMLFGCDTGGFTDNPAGYAARFMRAQCGRGLLDPDDGEGLSGVGHVPRAGRDLDGRRTHAPPDG